MIYTVINILLNRIDIGDGIIDIIIDIGICIDIKINILI